MFLKQKRYFCRSSIKHFRSLAVTVRPIYPFVDFLNRPGHFSEHFMSLSNLRISLTSPSLFHFVLHGVQAFLAMDYHPNLDRWFKDVGHQYGWIF